MTQIIEAAPREVMTKREKALKKKLIALLRDDGKGHRHAKYAARLEDFLVKIVAIKDDPEMTAAVDFKEVTIYISEGFLTDPDTFYQLNVLMRHELAHYLMQHQIRMMDQLISKYGKDGATRISMSKSIHRLLNIIEDFEISNKRYTSEDKLIVKNMTLNFEVIGGLVTEEIRSDWQSLNVIEMYELLSQEIEGIQRNLRRSWGDYSQEVSEIGERDKDWLKRAIRNEVYTYANEKSQTNFLGHVDKFLNNRALYHFVPYDRPSDPCIVKFSSLPENFQNIVKVIYDEIVNTNASAEALTNPDIGYLKKTVKQIISSIVRSSPFDITEVYGTKGNVITKLYTPEEKFIAVDTLKAMLPTLELFQTWYDKVIRVLGDTSKYSTADLESILAALD